MPGLGIWICFWVVVWVVWVVVIVAVMEGVGGCLGLGGGRLTVVPHEVQVSVLLVLSLGVVFGAQSDGAGAGGMVCLVHG